MTVFWTLVSILASILAIMYMWMKKKYKYWEEKGVAHDKPLPVLGNLSSVLTLQKPFNRLYGDAYNNYPNEKVVGVYEIVEPVLVVRDNELMQRILVKDFQHFTDHPMIGNEHDSVLSKGLFNLKGKLWRSVRYKVSPTFTTGKLKAMFPLMDGCVDELVSTINKNRSEVVLKDYLHKYALNVLASAVFGIEYKDAFANKFAEMSNTFFNSGFTYFLRQIFLTIFPKLGNSLNVRFFPTETEHFFSDVIDNTFKQREQSNVERNDYLQFLLKLKQQGTLDVLDKDIDDNYLNLDEKVETGKFEMSPDILTGQAMQFLIAGFDPPVNTLLFAMFELAKREDLQEKARNEVKACIKKNGGFNYLAVKEMTYLEQCIEESVRLYNVVEVLQRQCTKPYVTPDGLEIEEGMRVMFPIREIMRDPQYFDDPETFDPDRFAPDKKIPFVFIPFGTGPRICIGMRYAYVQIKVCLSKLLLNFKFTLNNKTKLPLELHKYTFFPILKTKILLDFTPIEQ